MLLDEYNLVEDYVPWETNLESDDIETNSMNELFEYVRSERCTHAACSSAQEGVNLKGVSEKIINEEAYKSDYEAITSKLLFEKVSYETAIETLKEVVSSTLFV